MTEPRSLSVRIADAVATIRFRPSREVAVEPVAGAVHFEIADALEALRTNDAVRVVVLTGEQDGEFLIAPPRPRESVRSSDPPTNLGVSHRLTRPDAQWHVGTLGIVRCHMTMAEMEKPIIARVNGDAIGFGQSLVLNSDLIVAREDARITDIHLAAGEVPGTRDDEVVGPPRAIAPGDGAASLAPLFMAPPLAKEYLMLSQVLTAAELAERRLINYAVPMEDLDATVDKLVAALLRRDPYAIGWTKRLANRHVVQQLNMTLDASVAMEMLGFVHLGSPAGQ